MMLSYFSILRLSVCLLAFFAVFVGAFISGFTNPFQIILASSAAFLIAGAGNVLNDYFDYESDKINKPHRFIPSGKISRKNALYYSIVLLAISFSFFVYLNFKMFLLAGLNLLLILLYNWRLKRFPLIGNFVPSWLAASSFIFGGLLSNGLNVVVIIISMMAFTSNVGREIAKSIEDMMGDAKVKARTLPIVFGRHISNLLAIFFVLLAIIVSPLPYVFGLLNINYLYVVLVSDILFTISLFILFVSSKKSQQYMKIAMIVGIISFIVGKF